MENKKFIGFKDIVIVTLLSTLTIVLSLALSMPFAASQHLVLFAANGLIMLVGGPIFILAMSKAPRTGAMFLYMFILAIYITIIGQLMIGVIFTIGAIICELSLIKGYHKPKRIIIAYMLYAALYTMGSYLPYILMTEQFTANMLAQGFPAETVEAMMSIYASPLLIGLASLNSAVWAGVGGFVGYKLLKKHFKPAGVA